MKNGVIGGKHGRRVLLDIYYPRNEGIKGVIIFCHGFKGFKDWGPFNIVAEQFADAGFIFIKFNFSHNGTTQQHPQEFADLDAFGSNNPLIELDDLQCVVDYVSGTVLANMYSSKLLSQSEHTPDEKIKIYLIGHSRGGGIVILKGTKDPRISKIITLASINEYGNFFSGNIQLWKKNGVIYVENMRTNQQLPVYYQYYETVQANKEMLDIHNAVASLSKPLLIIHGTDDETVPVAMAKAMHSWNPSKTKLILMEGANHTFGGMHPWLYSYLPKDFSKVFNEIISFIQS
jgi:pimeloyl-ACP methyl ester carboxylesterase